MDPYNSADTFPGARPPAANAANPSNPYAAPGARLAEPQLADRDRERASRMSRLGAVFLDGLIVGAPAGVAIVIAMGMSRRQEGLSAGAGILFGLVAIWVIGFSIYQLMLLHRSGQTFGKQLMGVRIVRTDGSRASLGRILGLRYLAPGLIGAIPFLGGLFKLADVLFIFGEEKRCIHDYFADTIVVEA